MLYLLLALLLLVAVIYAVRVHASGATYSPLTVSRQFRPRTEDLNVQDKGRNRAVRVRLYLPPGNRAAPIILFSHGLGGSRKGCAYLGRHWAKRGYVAVFLQHAGSDSGIWQGLPSEDRMTALKGAANSRNTLYRVKDVRAVIDQLERWNRDRLSPLAGRLDIRRIGMAGHSYGALTTQLVSGQQLPLEPHPTTDERIKAALVLSPISPRHGNPRHAFSRARIPWMLMTGTHDIGVIGEEDAESRRAVYPALPPGGKYELVLDGAEHFAFTDRPMPGDKGKRNPRHHRTILALSTAFWDAYLRADPAALAWLNGRGPATVLGKRDAWQRK